METFALESPPPAPRKKRLNKAPEPRFKHDISGQLDPIHGCPDLHVPKDHPVRLFRALLGKLNLADVEAKYSSQGRYGYHPRHTLGALVFGSLLGIHESTKLAERLKHDLALRLVAGGHAISAGVLRAFRRNNAELFERANEEVLALANSLGLIDVSDLAVDSVRLRADASQKSVRTLERSKKRLEELGRVDLASLSDEEKSAHSEKVQKHLEAVRLCEDQGRRNIVTTCPSAGLMQFPNGGAAPGHRATVVAAGIKHRLIVGTLVDASGNDFGKFGPAVMKARKTLEAAGVKLDDGMQVAADSGYFSATDIAFASENKTWLKSLIDVRERHHKHRSGGRGFSVDDFTRSKDGKMVCPAQRQMVGPIRDGERTRWEGVGCESCGLKPQCTSAKKRIVTLDLEFAAKRDAMVELLRSPEGRARYNRRIATVEPVFSMLEDSMNFRRVSSRFERTVRAEILLKVLAYNLSRLAASKRLRLVRMSARLR